MKSIEPGTQVTVKGRDHTTVTQRGAPLGHRCVVACPLGVLILNAFQCFFNGFQCFFNAFPNSGPFRSQVCGRGHTPVTTGDAYFQCFSMLSQWFSMLLQCFSMPFQCFFNAFSMLFNVFSMPFQRFCIAFSMLLIAWRGHLFILTNVSAFGAPAWPLTPVGADVATDTGWRGHLLILTNV